MIDKFLLPDPEQLSLEEISLEAGTVVLKVVATQRSHSCPIYQASSSRVHSYYQRKLADLPCGGCRSV